MAQRSLSVSSRRISKQQASHDGSRLTLALALCLFLGFLLSGKDLEVQTTLHSLVVQADMAQEQQRQTQEDFASKDRCHHGEEESTDDPAKKLVCECPDPLVPTTRVFLGPQWKRHHKIMVEDAESRGGAKNNNTVDVLLIGDSLTERWRGTYMFGTKSLPQFKAVFDQYFPNGLALGSAGDITSETLWHLQNGFLPDNLQPQIIQLLIGTNNMGRTNCNKETTLKGILNIAATVHHSRPKIPIVIHGLLPRSDQHGNPRILGQVWEERIVWINQQLQDFCQRHRGMFYYTDNSSLFLSTDPKTKEVVLQSKLVPDGLHPSLEGYKKWAPQIASNLKKVLQDASLKSQ